MSEIKRIEKIVTKTSGKGGFPSFVTHRKVVFIYQGDEYRTRKAAEDAKRVMDATEYRLVGVNHG